MTVVPDSGAEREFCPAVNDRTGWRCDFAAHPWQTHWTWVDGELKVWSTPTPDWENRNLSGGDQLRDAPEALRRHALEQETRSFLKRDCRTMNGVQHTDAYEQMHPSAREGEPACGDVYDGVMGRFVCTQAPATHCSESHGGQSIRWGKP